MTIREANFIDFDSNQPSRAELEFAAGLIALRARRESIYRDWRPSMVPNVTLEQAACLLLGDDPLSAEPVAASFRELRELRFRQLLNRLECAVAENELRPVGKAVEGLARRFRLAEIAATAVRIGISTDYARELIDSIQEAPVTASHFETAELRERAEAHKAFLLSLGATVARAEPKSSGSRRRKTVLDPLNAQLTISRAQYNEGWRQFVAQQHPSINPYVVSDAVLNQDRSDLNIRLQPGRKPSRSLA